MSFRSSSRVGLFLVLVCLFAAPASAREALWDELPWDTRLGVSWYERRAEAGNPQAALYAAQMHERGIGTAADPAEAARWYARAAEAGIPRALFKTARAEQLGLLGAPDPQRAVELYGRASEAGLGLASFNLAVMHDQGRGIPRDRTRAAELYERAWRQGVAKAGLNLAVLYLTGAESRPKRAYAWLDAAARAGLDEASEKRDRLGDILGPDLVAEAQAIPLPALGDG
jgi:hypothetical protein